MQKIPVITIDGPSGCGKGTLAQRLAQALNWHFLDSGALYRTVAWAVLEYQFDMDSEPAKWAQFIHSLKIQFAVSRFKAEDQPQYQLLCNGIQINDKIRSESCGNAASKIGALPIVRSSLLQLQRDFRQAPGLVTDGRDMGSVIFPDAKLKFFLLASPEKRAERRYLQLKSMGIAGSLREVLEELRQRDERDQNRVVAPLKSSDDMIVIDTSELTANQVFAQAMEYIRQQGL